MSIDQHNYELYILDYYEGKLDADASRELLLYLEQDPEAKEAFESYEAIVLEPDLNKQFEHKSVLKKTGIVGMGNINELNFENFFIESIEQNLNQSEQHDLSDFLIKNPQLQKTFELYQKTVLKPDLSVVFKGKELLKRSKIIALHPATIRRRVLTTAAVAAMLAVVVISGIIIRNFNFSEKSGNRLMSSVDFTGSKRNIAVIPKQTSVKNNHPSALQMTKTEASENKTFADLNSSIQIITANKPEPGKNMQINPSQNTNELAMAVLTERNELTDAFNSREQLLSRRNKENKSTNEEGLADYLVSGIKNAARSSTKNQDQIENNKRLGFWDIAGLGVFTYNKLADKNVKLDRETDASGKMLSLNLEDENDNEKEKK
jgi:hypothetical protein